MESQSFRINQPRHSWVCHSGAAPIRPRTLFHCLPTDAAILSYAMSSTFQRATSPNLGGSHTPPRTAPSSTCRCCLSLQKVWSPRQTSCSGGVRGRGDMLTVTLLGNGTKRWLRARSLRLGNAEFDCFAPSLISRTPAQIHPSRASVAGVFTSSTFPLYPSSRCPHATAAGTSSISFSPIMACLASVMDGPSISTLRFEEISMWAKWCFKKKIAKIGSRRQRAAGSFGGAPAKRGLHDASAPC